MMRCCVQLFLMFAAIGCAFSAQAVYQYATVDYPGAVNTALSGITNSGQVVGEARFADGSSVPFLYDSKKGSFTILPAVPGYRNRLIGINEPGVIVGTLLTDAPTVNIGLILDKKGHFTTFSHPAPLTNTQARSIGNSGLVTGIAWHLDTSDPDSCNWFIDDSTGFTYDPKSNTYTDFPHSPETVAQGINDRGEIVGSIVLDAGVACADCVAGRYGFLRSASGDFTYFRVNGRNTAARGITDSGLIAGFGRGVGFVVSLSAVSGYQSLTVPAEDLLSVPDPRNNAGTVVESINNAGVITGGWNEDTGNVDRCGNPILIGHGLIATPIPNMNQHGFTGSWYEAATSGQGLEVEVFPDMLASGVGFVFVSWFTYDTVVGGVDHQRWYTVSGPVVSGQHSALLTIYQNIGGNFTVPPITKAEQVGTATLSFDTCSSGQLSYNFTDGTGRAGSIPLTRLTQNVSCSTATARPTNVDFAFSGNWYDPATSGQGFTVEVNPNNPTLFAAWYTYAPNSASAGVAGQRWYTALPTTTFAPGSRSIDVTIYEDAGGLFNTPTVPLPQAVPVGGGTIAFQSCSAATFSYNFTGGTSVGLSGKIALSRVGRAPPGCTL